MAYKLMTGSSAVIRLDDMASIPPDPRNIDWQAFLAWLADGNTPVPADVPTAAQAALTQLLQHDADIFRILEALVDVLLAKGVIAGSDFSPALRTLYLARKSLRATAGV